MEKQYNEKDIVENLRRIQDEIQQAAASAGRSPQDVHLMAVTKTVPAEVVNLAIRHGVRLLGENRAQELAAKYDDYEKDGVSIHFIGHLQTNKVRQIVDKVDMIHSVGSIRLAREIAKRAAGLDKTMDVLVEVNIGNELTKAGATMDQVADLVQEMAQLSHLRVRGLMTIPPFDATPAESEGYFSRIRQLSVDIKGKNIDNVPMDVLSMGMSGDFPLAIRHGATIVRVGSAIFGSRA